MMLLAMHHGSPALARALFATPVRDFFTLKTQLLTAMDVPWLLQAPRSGLLLNDMLNVATVMEDTDVNACEASVVSPADGLPLDAITDG